MSIMYASSAMTLVRILAMESFSAEISPKVRKRFQYFLLPCVVDKLAPLIHKHVLWELLVQQMKKLGKIWMVSR